MNIVHLVSRSIFCMLAIIIVASSCDDDQIDTISDFGYDYFPLELGNYIIYELDSIVYDDFNDTVFRKSLLVREITESTFIDAGGRESFRIQREYKLHETDDWGDYGYDIWFAYIDSRFAERVEENNRYLKLAFPLRLNKMWEGNIHIDTRAVDVDSGAFANPNEWLDGWEYEITSLDEPLSINDLDFDSTLTVIQESYGTLLDTTGSREMYAKHVGLIFKELYWLETQCIAGCIGIPWEEKAKKGFIVRQKILEYGQL